MLTANTVWKLQHLTKKHQHTLLSKFTTFATFNDVPFDRFTEWRHATLDPGDDYQQVLSLQLNQKQTSRWFAARQLLRPSIVHFDTGHIFSLQALPKSQPTLTIPTIWATVDGHKEFTTLIDTGCNTSIIHSDLLHTLRDDDGNHFNVVEMKNRNLYSQHQVVS